MKSTFKKILLWSIGGIALYVLSIGPVSRWVMMPLRGAPTVAGFTDYDRRVSLYFSLYRPIRWLCWHWTADSLLMLRITWSWQAHWFSEIQPPHPEMPARTYVNVPLGDPRLTGGASTGRDAVDVVNTLKAYSCTIHPGGYAYYLPRSGLLIIHATEDEIRLASEISSDPVLLVDPLTIQYHPPQP